MGESAFLFRYLGLKGFESKITTPYNQSHIPLYTKMEVSLAVWDP
jgi:hypothetical protein